MKETILLVDDEQGIRTVMGLSLRDAGYNVITVARGRKPCSFRGTAHPHRDHRHQDARHERLDLLKHIKILAPETEVILISGHADLGNGIQGLKLEASDSSPNPSTTICCTFP